MKAGKWVDELRDRTRWLASKSDGKLALLALAGVLLVIIVPLLITRLLAQQYIQDEKEQLKARAETVIAVLFEEGTASRPERQGRGLERAPGFVYLEVYDKKGKKVFSKFTRGRQAYRFKLDEVEGVKGPRIGEVLSLDGNKITEYIKPVKNSEKSGEIEGWVRTGFESGPLYKSAAKVRTAGHIVSAAGTLFVLIVLWWLRHYVFRPMGLLQSDLENVDLRDETEVKLDRGHEGRVAGLAGAMDRILEDCRRRLESSYEVVENLEQTVELLSETVDEIYSISSHQSSGATEQAASVYQASSTSKEIAASAGKIADTADKVSDNARQTRQASDSGQEDLSAAIAQVRDVASKVEEVAGKIVELGEQSQKITRIIDLIREISEHTNLLALNAGIEAAGAGEEGKRFQVVAQEIRRLANRTLDSSQIVVELIEKIQTSTNSTVMVTEETMKSAKEAENIMENMNQSFQNILNMVDHTLKAGQEISLSTRQQTTACEQMVSTVMEVSEVASEVEKGAKETEDSLTKINELSNTLKELAHLASGKKE